jgi:hypothetical protein
VRVKVRGLEAGFQHPRHLQVELTSDVQRAEGDCPCECLRRFGQRLAQTAERPRADQRKVDADVQRRRMILGQDDGVMKLASHRHESSSGDDAVAMRLDNALVDVASEAEVVGVDDQALQRRLI